MIAVGIKAAIDAALFTPTNKDEFIRTMKEGGRYAIEATFFAALIGAGIGKIVDICKNKKAHKNEAEQSDKQNKVKQ